MAGRSVDIAVCHSPSIIEGQERDKKFIMLPKHKAVWTSVTAAGSLVVGDFFVGKN